MYAKEIENVLDRVQTGKNFIRRQINDTLADLVENEIEEARKWTNEQWESFWFPLEIAANARWF